MEPVAAQIRMERVFSLSAVNGATPLEPVATAPLPLPPIVLQDGSDPDALLDLLKIQLAIHDRAPPPRCCPISAAVGGVARKGTGQPAPVWAHRRNNSCLAACIWRANSVSLAA